MDECVCMWWFHGETIGERKDIWHARNRNQNILLIWCRFVCGRKSVVIIIVFGATRRSSIGKYSHHACGPRHVVNRAHWIYARHHTSIAICDVYERIKLTILPFGDPNYTSSVLRMRLVLISMHKNLVAYPTQLSQTIESTPKYSFPGKFWIDSYELSKIALGFWRRR